MRIAARILIGSVVVTMWSILAYPAPPAALAGRPASALSAGAAQVPFEQAIRDLSSPEVEPRLRTVRMLKDAAYPEAAVPIARLVTDPEDVIQLEAIAAELNIFQARKVITRRRVGLVIEVRTQIAAEAAFEAGPLGLGARPVPPEVLTALRAGSALRVRNARCRTSWCGAPRPAQGGRP
jgi:hypothetical protein